MPHKKVKDMSRSQQKAAMANMNNKIYVKPHKRNNREYRRNYDSISENIEMSLEDIKNLIEKIENDPECTQKLLAKIALLGISAAAPELYPILNSIFLIYEGGKLVYNFSNDDLKTDDFEFLKLILNKGISKENVTDISPAKVHIYGRKAEYINSILNNLEQHTTKHLDRGSIERELMSIVLKMDSKSFLSKNKEGIVFLEISNSFDVDKKILFEVFEDTLRKNDLDLYAKLLMSVV